MDGHGRWDPLGIVYRGTVLIPRKGKIGATMRLAMLRGLTAALCLALFCRTAACDEPASTPLRQKFQGLVEAHRQAQEEFSEVYREAKSDQERQRVLQELGGKASASQFAERFLALLRESPKDPVSLDAYRWILSREPSGAAADQATESLLRNWIEDEQLAGVCKYLTTYSCPAGDKLLRAAISKSPHRTVQAHACFSLAVSLKKQAARLAEHEPAERLPYEWEAQELLQRVIEKYGDLPEIAALGEDARAQLFELQFLGIGKSPPDIVGEDLNGTKMKLTDFRGNVVLIVFGSTSCGPCMSDVPHQLEILKRLKGQPFAIVGVNCDEDRELARKVYAEAGVAWRSFADGKRGPIVRQWNVTAEPTLYLLDGDGVIRYKGDRLRSIGIRTGSEGKPQQFNFLDEAVDKLFKEAQAKKP